jgi:hypothetical protein
MAFCPETPKEESRNCPGFGLSGLWELITPSSDLRLGWGLKQTCSSPQELSNNVLHSICAHRGQVDSWFLVVGSQTASLTSGPSFDHKLCCRCLNGSCKAIFDIYTSRPFQQYKEHIKARFFDPCNWALKFWESRRTPSSHFWECEFHPHTCLKVGLRQEDSKFPLLWVWVSSSHLPQSGIATSPETVLIWTPGTLWVHNSLFRPRIGMRFEANL